MRNLRVGYQNQRGHFAGGGVEVRVDGLRSRCFYFEDDPSRRLRPEVMTGADALEWAKALARGLSMTRSWPHQL